MQTSVPAITVHSANDPSAEVAIIDDAPVVEYAAEPWHRRDVIQFAALTLAGLVLLGAGAIGSGGEARLDDQVAFINLAVSGILVGAAGGGLWLIAGLRAVRRRKVVVKARIAARAAGEAGATTLAGATDGFVAGPAMTRYHRPDCSLVAGKPVSPAAREEHERAGRRPCGMCQR